MTTQKTDSFILITFLIIASKTVPSSQLHSVLLGRHSYARFNFPGHENTAKGIRDQENPLVNSSVKNVHISFTPLSTEGKLFFANMNAEYKAWMEITVERGKIYLLIGQEGENTIRLSVEENVVIYKEHIVKLTLKNLKISLSLNGGRAANHRLNHGFQNSLILTNRSEMHLGDYSNFSGRYLPSGSALTTCLHNVVINGHIAIIPEDAVYAIDITPCPTQSDSDCHNQCNKNGICKKTVNCNDQLAIKQAEADGEAININNSEIEVKKNQTSLTFTLDQETFINSVNLHLNASCRYNNVSMGRFFIQFAVKGKYFNYTQDQQTKIFKIEAYIQTYLISWPVLAQSIKIRLAERFIESCGLTFRVNGCSKIDFRATFSEFLPPNRWSITLQSPLSLPIDDNLLSFGVVNEDFQQIIYPTSAHQSMLVFKGKLLDILSAFHDYKVDVKVEFLLPSNSMVASSWLLHLSDCNPNFDKVFLLQLIKSIRAVENNMSELVEKRCQWIQLNSIQTNASTKEMMLKMFIRRSKSSLDAFKIIRHVVIDPAVASSSPLVVSSVKQCARECLEETDPLCTAFSVARSYDSPSKSAKYRSSFHCLLATFDVVDSDIMLVRSITHNTYILSENFRSYLPLFQDVFQRIKLPAALNSGFQCQCVNHMFGSRCDNESLHSFRSTYQAIITSRSDAIELNCQVEESVNLNIEIQFALLGKADVLTTNHFPLDLHDNVVDSLNIVKAICSKREVCLLTIELLETLLPNNGYSYLEVRYICKESMKIIVSQLSLESNVNTDRFENDAHEDFNSDSRTFLLDAVETDNAASSSLEKESTTASGQTRTLLKTISSELTTTNPAASSFLPWLHNTERLFSPTPSKSNFNSKTSSTVESNLFKLSRTSAATHCPKKIIRGVQFPHSIPGLVKAECPNETIGNVFLVCFANGTWGNEFHDAHRCAPTYLTTAFDLAKKAFPGNIPISASASSLAKLQAEALRSLNTSNLQPEDIKDNVKLMENLLVLEANEEEKLMETPIETIKQSLDLAKNFQSTINSLLDTKFHHVWNKMPQNKRSSVALNLTKLVENVGLLHASKLTTEKTEVNHLDNVIFQVSAIRNTSTLNQTHRIGFHSQSQKTRANERDWAFDAGSIDVPFIRKNQTTDVVFAIYRNIEDLLGSSFTSFRDNEHNKSAIFDENEIKERVSHPSISMINSHVISAKTRPTVEKLFKEDKIKIILRHKTAFENNARCVFWKESEKSSSLERSETVGFWSDEGCLTIASNSTHTECECVHLTNFAILMDVVGVQMDKTHDTILYVVTWVGCLLSVFCLMLCLFCFNALPGIRSIRNSIHKNLCFTLMLAQIAFISGADKTDKPILCPLIAGLLHYLFLVVFAWMCMEGLHIYASLVQVFEIDKSSRLICYYIFSYGGPSIVVAVSLALRYDGYGTKTSCWLAAKDDLLIWSFVGPALGVICINIFFFFVALRVMHVHRMTSPPYQTRFAEARKWLKGSSVLLCLLGIPWIFGIFFVNGQTVIMAYIFTICNAFQGVFILVFHCVLNDRVRGELTKYFRRSRLCHGCVKRRYRISSINANTRTACITTSSIQLKRRKSSSPCEHVAATTSKSWYQLTPDIEIKDDRSCSSSSNISREAGKAKELNIETLKTAKQPSATTCKSGSYPSSINLSFGIVEHPTNEKACNTFQDEVVLFQSKEDLKDGCKNECCSVFTSSLCETEVDLPCNDIMRGSFTSVGEHNQQVGSIRFGKDNVKKRNNSLPITCNGDDISNHFDGESAKLESSTL